MAYAMLFARTGRSVGLPATRLRGNRSINKCQRPAGTSTNRSLSSSLASKRSHSYRYCSNPYFSALSTAFNTPTCRYSAPNTYASCESPTDAATSGPQRILATSSAVAQKPNVLRRIAKKLALWARSILDIILVGARATEISLILSPLLVLTPASIASVHLLKTKKVSDISWWYTLHSLQLLGPAFTKLSQWAATRRDLFPPHICSRLSELHDAAKLHSWKHTDRVLTKAFGANYEEQGLHIDPNDIIGSGSAAQVYRARLNAKWVAVKVLHPNIAQRVERDLNLMRRVAALLDSIPPIKMLSLPRAVDSFAGVLNKQVDLRIEGENLARFHNNFTYQKKSLLKGFSSTNIPSSSVLFPQPIEGWVQRDVLIEEFVDNAQPVSDFLKDNSNEGMALRKEIAGPLLRCFLKMVFLDNFTHSDLHPGNVLIQSSNGKTPHRIVFLDAGLATSLSSNDRRNLVDLFRAVILDDGEQAGRLMVERARFERCSQVEGGVDAFAAGVGAIVSEFHDNRKKGLTLGAVRIGSLLGRVLDLCRIHGVEIDPAMANIVLSTLVLEGLGRSLEPNLNLLDFALPFVLRAGKV